MASPHTDCPECPKCKATCGTAHHPELERSTAPTLWCVACGHDWIGTLAEIAQATAADAAWEREQQREERWHRLRQRARLPLGTAQPDSRPRRRTAQRTAILPGMNTRPDGPDEQTLHRLAALGLPIGPAHAAAEARRQGARVRVLRTDTGVLSWLQVTRVPKAMRERLRSAGFTETTAGNAPAYVLAV